MSHTVVHLAKQVISDRDSYPNYIILRAENILNTDSIRRNAIKELWCNYRKVLREYRKIRKSSLPALDKHDATTLLINNSISTVKLKQRFRVCYEYFVLGQNQYKFIFRTFYC